MMDEGVQAVYLLKRKHRLHERQVGSLTIEYEVGALKVEGGEAFGGRRQASTCRIKVHQRFNS